MDTKDKFAALKQSSLFAKMPEKHLKEIASKSTVNHYEAGAAIIEENDPQAVAFYIVLEGKVAISQAGKEVNTIGPGGYFGEVSLLSHDYTPRTAQCTASEPTECLVLVKWDFQAMVKNSPDMAFVIMSNLAERLSETHRALG